MNYGYERWLVQRVTEQGVEYLTWDGWGKTYWTKEKRFAGGCPEDYARREASFYNDPAVTAVKDGEA